MTAAASLYRPHSRMHSLRRGLWRFLRKQPLGSVGAAIVVLFIVLGAIGPYIVPFDTSAIAVGPRLSGPTLDHPFGTDAFGRDQFSRIIVGARLSVFVGFGAVTIGMGAATILGLWVGYVGGRADMVIQRVVDGVMAYPPLVLALVAVGVLGPSALNVMLVLGVLMIASNSRVVRGSTLAIKESMYVEAARVVGAGTPRVIVRHVLPNVVSPLIVIATVSLGSVILAEGSAQLPRAGRSPAHAVVGADDRGRGVAVLLRDEPLARVVPGHGAHPRGVRLQHVRRRAARRPRSAAAWGVIANARGCPRSTLWDNVHRCEAVDTASVFVVGPGVRPEGIWPRRASL